MNTQHKTIAIFDSDGHTAENIKKMIESGVKHFNLTILTAHNIIEITKILNDRTDIDLLIMEIQDDSDQEELDLITKARNEQKKHLRIVVHTFDERIVNSQSGDFANHIPRRDRFMKGHRDGDFPGTEDSLRSKIRDWLGAL